MSDEMTENFLEHYGVKGMKWGRRKFAIQEARGAVKGKATELRKAERDWKNASEDGKSAALKTLKQKEKAEWENRQVAATLTRGEQFVLGIGVSVLTTPIGGLAAVGAAGVVNSDLRKFHSKYPND